jgi:hypothetical protein
VIGLVPRINFAETLRNPVLIKQDEPFECGRCGEPFGSRSFIEAIAKKLAAAPDIAIERIKMCERCRVETFHQVGEPT